MCFAGGGFLPTSYRVLLLPTPRGVCFGFPAQNPAGPLCGDSEVNFCGAPRAGRGLSGRRGGSSQSSPALLAGAGPGRPVHSVWGFGTHPGALGSGRSRGEGGLRERPMGARGARRQSHGSRRRPDQREGGMRRRWAAAPAHLMYGLAAARMFFCTGISSPSRTRCASQKRASSRNELSARSRRAAC